MRLPSVLSRMHLLHPYALGALAGALGAAALRMPDGWPLAFAALIPLLYATRLAHSIREIFIAGTITGAAIAGAGSWWMLGAISLPAFYGVPYLPGALFVVVSWGTVSLAIGIWTGVWAAILHSVKMDEVWKAILAISLYLLSLLASFYAFNLVTAAEGVANPPFYSPGFLGYALADNLSFLQAAAHGGVWTLTALVVCANLLFYLFLTRFSGNTRRYGVAALALLLVAMSLAPVAGMRESIAPAAGAITRVGFMSLNISFSDFKSPAAFDAKKQQLAESALDKLVSAKPAILLVPEDIDLSRDVLDRATLAASTTAIVHSEITPALNGRVARSGYARTGTNDEWLRNKIVLVPNGEYLTGAITLIATALGQAAAASDFARSFTFTNGELGYPLTTGSVRASLLFCSEILDPGFAASIKKAQGANLLLIASSHVVFSDGTLLDTDTLRFARVQSVEAGLPSVTSTTGGAGYALDRYGRITRYASALEGGYASALAEVSIKI